MKDGPHHIVTEFWYLEANQVENLSSWQEEVASPSPSSRTGHHRFRVSQLRVGGRLWHAAFQEVLKKQKIPWSEVAEHEVYRFGAGAPVVSQLACIYPVLIHVQWDVIRDVVC